ncbi:MAG: chemotaxis protein CheW [Bdellovibrionota bacterium]
MVTQLEACREYVSFRLEHQTLGIPVTQVQEVISGLQVTPVPLAGTEVRGLINLRGQIVTVIDLRRRLGMPERAPDDPCMNVIVRNGDEEPEGLYSLLVDSIGDVLNVHDIPILPPPATLDGIWRRICAGVFRLDQAILVVLDVPSVLNFQEEKNDEKEKP